MGTLRELDSNTKNTHLLITTSNLAEIYVYDTLKEGCQATLDSIFDVNTNGSFKNMLELVNIPPYLADKWLFVIEYKKVKSLLKSHTGIFESETSCFLLKVSTYKDYLEVKKLVPIVNDLYLSYIRSNDVMFLLQGFGLSQKSMEFVSLSYARDPDKVFTLRNELLNGAEVKSQKDIVSICGRGSGSIAHFAIQLLKEKPTSEKSYATIYRNRMKTMVELMEAYGVSTFKNFLTATVKDFISIKELYLAGTIYKRVINLPDCYDEAKLSRYNMYLRRIEEEIPHERILRLYVCLKESGYWKGKLDAVEFLYNYYEGM